MIDDEERAAESVLSALIALVTAWSSVRTQGRIAAELGITIPEGDVRGLHALGRFGAPVRAGQLAEELMISRPTMSKMIARLTESGLVQRAASAGDARSVLLSLTPAGRDAYQRLVDAGLRMVAAALHGSDQADPRITTDLLQRLVEQLPGQQHPHRPTSAPASI